MERYFIHTDEVIDFILNTLLIVNKGEIFVPKMKKFSVKELADEISKKQKIIGLRQGEKIQEILLNNEEKERAIERKDMWVINPYKKK